MTRKATVSLDGREFEIRAFNIGELEQVTEIFDTEKPSRVAFKIVRMALKTAVADPAEIDALSPTMDEVQTAFNVLEEAIWKRIETEIPHDDLARSLALVSTVLGSGKDRLARSYVALATQSQVPALDVQALFRAPDRS